MPRRRYEWHSKSTCQILTPFLAVAMLLVGVLCLIYYFAVIKSQTDDLLMPKAEPVWLGGKNGSSASSFPFEKELWTNMSASGACPKHFFPCSSSKRCVAMQKRCDGQVDCHGAEDELSCLCAFRMPASKFCDKYPDCFDESDEGFCSYCPQGKAAFNCGDGKCIDRKRVCDSVVDCANYMDENFCFRLSLNISFTIIDKPEPPTSANTKTLKTGFLLRNRNGAWYPVCANPYDFMQNSLASFACVSITANPLASSSHQYLRFPGYPSMHTGDYVYHYQGKFVQWHDCLTASGIFITCDDARCGLNPQQLVPQRPRGRIVGGEVSKPGTWPWHAAIYKNGTYACGATLINDRWLISAAHCFLNYRFNYYEIQLGMLRRRSFTPHQTTYKISEVVPHPKFNIIVLEYDIAMLKTSEAVAFDFWVRPICLPRPDWTETAGSYCTAIGWGDTGEFEDDSDELLEVHVPLTSSCRRNLDRWLCAGYIEGGKDACQGDSGGPLMCLGEDGLSWYIAGVISAGTGCARPRTPGMYTRVVYFLEWIQQVMTTNRYQDGSPLSACPGLTCAVVGGGDCLRQEMVCDGHIDCYEAEDEVNCTKTHP